MFKKISYVFLQESVCSSSYDATLFLFSEQILPTSRRTSWPFSILTVICISLSIYLRSLVKRKNFSKVKGYLGISLHISL